MRITLKQAFELAFAHERAGRAADARAIYAEILEAIPDHPGALLKAAEHDIADGAHESARTRLRVALDTATAQGLPVHDILFALARLAIAQGDHAAAREACERALAAAADALAPRRLVAWLDLEAGHPREAELACRRVLERHARDGETLHLLGKALKAQGAYGAARSALARAAVVSGDDPEVLTTWGAVCVDAGDSDEAIEHLERAVVAGAKGAGPWDNLGLAYRARSDYVRALAAFARAVEVDPSLTPALANLVHTSRYLCEWDGLEAIEQRLVATLETPGSDPRWSPYIALCCALTPAQQLAVARRWSRAVLPQPAMSDRNASRRASGNGRKLRVGYLSSDFREHPTGRLMAGLFENADRSRFEIYGYSYGADEPSALRNRIRAAFGSAWRDVDALSDVDAAAVIRDDALDVLIERKGHTYGGRLGILASRPAPVQLHYMSFAGTLGYDAIDGLIADEVVIPAGDEAFYHERVWRLPRCYFVNDGKRGLPDAATRKAAGLPEAAVVLACLNQSYKLSAPVYAAWMNALARVPNAVLWLLSASDRAHDNLRERAGRAGIDPARLIFAPLLPQDEHIARLRCADLALDTLPYGSHTTGCDALWAGVPMLTCPGETFASRVGESILRASGLSDLVASSLAEYESRLVELASSPEKLREYRAYLERTRDANPLFDTAGFARDWEALLERACEETPAAG